MSRYRGLLNSPSNRVGKGIFKKVVEVDGVIVSTGNISTKQTVISKNINTDNNNASTFIKKDKHNFLFNGEGIIQQSEYLKKSTVLIETTDNKGNLFRAVGSGVLIHENEIYPNGTSNKIYVITCSHVVLDTPFLKDNGDIVEESDVYVAKYIKVMYFTKNNQRKISYLRPIGYSLSSDLALCEFINLDEVNTTNDSTWYTQENINSIYTAKLYKINLNNLSSSTFNNGSKVIACGHTYVDDPFSITCGYIRSGSHMNEECDTKIVYRQQNDTSYNVMKETFSPYFLTALDLGPGNSGCGIFLQNGLELVGIHSTSIKEGDQHTASVNAEIPPYILNSNIFERMIIGYNNHSNITHRVVSSMINVDIYSTTEIMDFSTSNDIVKNAVLLDDINGNLTFGRLDLDIPNPTQYTLLNGQFSDTGNELSFFTDYNLLVKVDELSNTSEIIRSYNIGDEYPSIPVFALKQLIEPNTFIRLHYYSDMEDYDGNKKSITTEIMKVPELPFYLDKEPYNVAYISKV